MKIVVRILLLIFFHSFLFQSCKKFEWNNPYDPQCPKALFSPSGFGIVLDGTSVRLSWSQSNTLIAGFKIVKQIKGESGVSNIDISANASQYVDANIEGGKTYTYQIYAHAGTNESNRLSAEILVQFRPVLSTSAVVIISPSSVSLGGTISTDGGSPITARGVCWATVSSPTIQNSKTEDGTGVGSFSSELTGLDSKTRYYVRAYATNALGTSYGNEYNFTTVVVLPPTLSTASVTNITGTTASSGGNVTSDGGDAITAKGVIWSTSPNPAVSLSSKTIDGSGTGPFISELTALTPSTTYYVRAYATNSAGTNFGEEYSFTTSAASLYSEGNGVTDIDGNVYNSIIIGTQEIMESNLMTTSYSDGTTILNLTDLTQFTSTTSGAYVNYFNDPAYADVYGRLYNYNAVIDNRKVCPAGWHVPTFQEWEVLENYLKSRTTDVTKSMKTKVGWGTAFGVDASGDNSSGFNGLPGGRRGSDNFNDCPAIGYWWSTTSFSSNAAMPIRIFQTGPIDKPVVHKMNALSVRCFKD
jgi:uncharacterized protein (TIGR02145 family)